jgi:hypothetical protein
MLRGDSILRPNRKEDGKPDQGQLLPLPKDEQLRRVWDDTVRDAFAGMPNARNAHYQAAKAIYAALSADDGDRDTSLLDRQRWENAIQMATGGIQGHNGRNIVLPYGQDYGQFKDNLARRIDDLVIDKKLDEHWTRGALSNLPLESVGDGKYVFKVGDALLADKEGKVVKLDFRTPAPFRTSGYAVLDYMREPTNEELVAAEKPFLGPVGKRKRLERKK